MSEKGDIQVNRYMQTLRGTTTNRSFYQRRSHRNGSELQQAKVPSSLTPCSSSLPFGPSQLHQLQESLQEGQVRPKCRADFRFTVQSASLNYSQPTASAPNLVCPAHRTWSPEEVSGALF